MPRIRMIVVVGGLFIVAAGASVALTQEPLTPRNFFQDPVETVPQRITPSGRIRNSDLIYPVNPPEGAPQVYRARSVKRTVMEIVNEPVSAEEMKQLQAFQGAKQKLKDAKDEASRKAAMDVMQKHLATQFEQDLAQRENELKVVEEKVKQLRQQLDKRKLAKDEIVSLRLKTIVNNAEGLGFPGDDASQDQVISARPSPKDPYVYETPQTYDPEDSYVEPARTPANRPR